MKNKIDDKISLDHWYDEPSKEIEEKFKEITDDFILVATKGETSYTLMDTLPPDVSKIIMEKIVKEGFKVEKKQEPNTCYTISW